MLCFVQLVSAKAVAGPEGLSWEAAVNEGKKAISQMDLDADKAVKMQSKWTHLDDLQKHGWTKKLDELAHDTQYQRSWANLIAVNTESNRVFGNESEEFMLQRVEWKHGKAAHAFLFDPDFSVIFANSSQLLHHHSNKHKDYPTSPSDIILLAWQDYVQETIAKRATVKDDVDRNVTNHLHGLKAIVHVQIKNKNTHNILKEFWHKLGAEAPIDAHSPSAMVTDHGSDTFKALLGTPDGRAMAEFLEQHKGVLGLKTVDFVQASCWENLCGMAFGVMDVGGESRINHDPGRVDW